MSKMNTLCKNCGKKYGDHRDNWCPPDFKVEGFHPKEEQTDPHPPYDRVCKMCDQRYGDHAAYVEWCPDKTPTHFSSKKRFVASGKHRPAGAAAAGKRPKATLLLVKGRTVK